MVIDERAQFASIPLFKAFETLSSRSTGISDAAASQRLKKYGLNEIEVGRDVLFIFDLAKRFVNPLVILLIIIASFSYFFGDRVSTTVIGAMVAMSVGLSFIQERRARNAARKLGEMVQTTCKVVREGAIKEIPLKHVVPGDVINLSAGDMIAGDIRIVTAKDLFVNQASLTGESFPVEKFVETAPANTAVTPQLRNMAFMGSSVMSGIGTGLVIRTGRNTAFGSLTQKLAEAKGETSFDRQMKEFTWLMIRVILVVVIAITGIRALQHRNMIESLLFALAVAVQITPETLPMIVTLNLSRGALAMSRKKVIVKRLNSIQNLGAMDVLCSDKTGTLTMNEIILERHVNVLGHEDEKVFMYGYINSFYQTGIRNLLNAAVLKHQREDLHGYEKLDEVPFDFERKINSVAVKKDNVVTFIAIGSPEEIVARCTSYDERGVKKPLLPDHHEHILAEYLKLSADGFRVLAVAHKRIEEKKSYETKDESELTLIGYMGFLDPAKPSAKEAVAALSREGIAFKIVTGDSELVTKKICNDLGIETGSIVVGTDINGLSDEALGKLAEKTVIFARMTPEQKERIVKSLSLHGRTVGYLGDGINDGLSLRAADVGISVNNAVDVAKESAGIVLLEKDLQALTDGVLEGRKVYGNFMKYIRMTGMVNVGYMITTTLASIVLPFLPMAPVQMLLNNYLYEVGQVGIPGDNVDREYLRSPRKWHMRSVFLFMAVLGPIVSLFDFLMFSILWNFFGGGANPELFQTGWFIETMLAQMLLIFAIRTRKVPFIGSMPSTALMIFMFSIIGIVFALPFTPFAGALHLVVMPVAFYPAVLGLVAVYLIAVWVVKNWVIAHVAKN